VTFFLEAGLLVVIKVGPDFLLIEVDKQCTKMCQIPKINVMGPNKNALDRLKNVKKCQKDKMTKIRVKNISVSKHFFIFKFLWY
jgi:alpha/beta superfamily hydrolase